MSVPGKHPDQTEAVPKKALQAVHDYFVKEADRYQERAMKPGARHEYAAYAAAYRDAGDRVLAVLLLSTMVTEVAIGVPEGAV